MPLQLSWLKQLDWTGLKHSDETKVKMSKTRKGNGKGVTKIYRGDMIPEGWRLGRKMR